MVSNQEFQNYFGMSEVEHLSRTNFDHVSLLLSCGAHTSETSRPFKFLKFWTEKEDFMKVVRENWVARQMLTYLFNLNRRWKK